MGVGGCVPAWPQRMCGAEHFLVQLLQHVLTLGVREGVAEGEVGGDAAHLQQAMDKGQGELIL